jgi:translation initiation factor 2B subunit (eIF-2B alpha/beta/delta family)
MDRLSELRTAIAANTVPGGSAYGRAAAEVIALTLGSSDATGPELERLLDQTAQWLVETKPSMTSVRTVTALAAAALDGAASRASVRTVTALAAAALDGAASRDRVIEAMQRFIADSEASIVKVAQHADTYIKSGAKVLFHSFSASLVQILGRAASRSSDLTFLFTESRPYRESLRIVAELADTAVSFVAYSDASMALAAADADLVLVGADALFRDGSFANKIGSLPLALCCRHVGTPYYVVTELSKLYPGDPDDVAMEQRPPAELVEDWELWRSGRIGGRNQFFERVAAELVTAYLTDDGVLTPNALAHRPTARP